jgi:hypothetical protein
MPSTHNGAMTNAGAEILLTAQPHVVFEDVSLDFYEHLLREVGNGAVRITYGSKLCRRCPSVSDGASGSAA